MPGTFKEQQQQLRLLQTMTKLGNVLCLYFKIRKQQQQQEVLRLEGFEARLKSAVDQLHLTCQFDTDEAHQDIDYHALLNDVLGY